ncbi:uncharacterized protein [Mobula birostris]
MGQPRADIRMSPPRPLAAFKLLCAVASRFISHPVLRPRGSLYRVVDMTETAAAESAPPAAPAAATKALKKKKAAARTKLAGPRLGEQIDKIVADCRNRRGVSVIAIKKELAANGVNVEKFNRQIKMVIKKKLESGSLVHTKGAGVSGSLKAAKKESTAKKAKKPAAKIQAKKSAAKKTVAKKSPTKKQGVKKLTPKKAVAKKPAAKKAAAKKPATKKAAQKPKSPKKMTAAKAAKKSSNAKPKAKSMKTKQKAAKK